MIPVAEPVIGEEEEKLVLDGLCSGWVSSIGKYKQGTRNRDFLIRELKKKGINSRPFFFPIHHLPRYNENKQMSNANLLASSGMNLPSSVNLTDEQPKQICNTIVKVWKKK